MANKVILSTNNGEQIILQGNEPTQIRLQGTSVLSNEYTAGEGLILTGKQFSVDTDIVAEKTDIGNGTLTIQKNGTEVGTFDANSAENTTVNITVPTDNTQLINGMGYQRASDVQDAITGKANVDLDNLSATGNAKFTSMMLTDASNANPRLATYAELQEVKNMMLGMFDWANAVQNITISGNNTSALTTYTCPKAGYIFVRTGLNSMNSEAKGMRINDYPVHWKGTSVDTYRNLSNAYPVKKDDVISIYGYTMSITIDFVPRVEA